MTTAVRLLAGPGQVAGQTFSQNSGASPPEETTSVIDVANHASVDVVARFNTSGAASGYVGGSIESYLSLLWYASANGEDASLVWADTVFVPVNATSLSAVDRVIIQSPVRGRYLKVLYQPQRFNTGGPATNILTVFGSGVPLDKLAYQFRIGSGSFKRARQYWRASGSPTAAAEAVATVTINADGYLAAPISDTSYQVPGGRRLVIQSIGMHVVPPAAGQAKLRLRIRQGTTTAADELWSYALQAGTQGTTSGPSEAFTFPDGGFVVDSGVTICFTSASGATSSVLDFIVTGYLTDDTG